MTKPNFLSKENNRYKDIFDKEECDDEENIFLCDPYLSKKKYSTLGNSL